MAESSWVKWIVIIGIIFFMVWIFDSMTGGSLFGGGGGGPASKVMHDPGAKEFSEISDELFIIIPVIIFAILLLFLFRKKIFRRREPEPEEAPEGEEPTETITLGPPDPGGSPPKPVGDEGDKPEPPKKPTMKDPKDPPTPADPTYKPKKPKVPEGARLIISNLDKWFLPVRNQGDLGACAAFAGSSIFEYIYNREAGKATRRAKRSELFLWFNARIDQESNEGTAVHDLVRELKGSGNCDYKLWEFEDLPSEKFLKKPPKPAYSSGMKHLVVECKALSSDPDDWIGALAEENPIYIGAKIPGNFPGSDFSGRDFLEKPSSGSKGGHAMVIVGYDSHYPDGKAKNEAFKVRNSWGTDWGEEGGHIWIGRDTLKDMVNSWSGAWVFTGWKKGKVQEEVPEEEKPKEK